MTASQRRALRDLFAAIADCSAVDAVTSARASYLEWTLFLSPHVAEACAGL